jgi:hypothetical protein
MKPNETRIGNLVLHQLTKEPYKIKAYDILDLEKGMDSEILQPIPLTEDIINKCKFNFEELGFPDLRVSIGLISKDIHFVIGPYYHKLEYVHELQNLYKELTRVELKIKL